MGRAGSAPGDQPGSKLKGILVLTGDLTSERLEEIKRLGADGVIEKPVDMKKLVQALRSYGGVSQV
jgi:DNA-binding NarL/FixJ family response regulator